MASGVIDQRESVKIDEQQGNDAVAVAVVQTADFPVRSLRPAWRGYPNPVGSASDETRWLICASAYATYLGIQEWRST